MERSLAGGSHMVESVHGTLGCHGSFGNRCLLKDQGITVRSIIFGRQRRLTSGRKGS